MQNIAIIGSGLSGISTAKALVKRGIKPVLLDVGKTLDKERQAIVDNFGQQEQSNWDSNDLDIITSNPTVFNKGGYPKKLSFGSDYIYRSAHKSIPIDGSPPATHAKGGFSISWGGAIMPAHDNDMTDWPMNRNDLEPYYKEVLRELPFSASNDFLSKQFPLYHDNCIPLNLSNGRKELLDDIIYSDVGDNENFLFGQSRLLIQTLDKNGVKGCQYCGYCMSGCVYKCIYNSSRDLDSLIKNNKIEYLPNSLVLTISESGDNVYVTIENKNGVRETLLFDRVFIAAGAVNSTRIILESKQLYNFPISMKTTNGFILPMLRLKAFDLGWPTINTEPGIFFEFKNKNISDHWIHSQISTPNEIVLKRFNYNPIRNNYRDKILKFIFNRMIIAQCNMHSEHAGVWEMYLKPNDGCKPNIMVSKYKSSPESIKISRQVSRQLFKICMNFGCYAILPLLVSGTRGDDTFHLGGSMPMKLTPKKENETNLLGTPKGWSRTHVVDSSIFPSIPGTTIGLPAMANATRIASEVDLG